MARSLRISTAGFQKARNALEIKGWTQEYLAGAAGCSRQSVIKFLAKRPIEKRLFQNLCNQLGLEWEEIAELELEEEKSSNNYYADIGLKNNDKSIQMEHQVSSLGIKKQKSNDNSHLVITITGNIDNFLKNPNVQTALLALMQKISKDVSLTIEKIEEE